MEEADRLADNVVVIDRGRVIAEGHPDQLKSKIGGERVEVVLSDDKYIPATRALLHEVTAGEIRVDDQTCTVTAAVTDGVDDLRRVLQILKDRSIPVDDVGLRRPTLDDVFLSLTGHVAEEVAASPDGKKAGKKDGQQGERDDERQKEAV
jgi:ABC-2 type transport system ATP-binding protein